MKLTHHSSVKSLLGRARLFARGPLCVVGVLWPLALLAPFVPGLPRPTNGGMTWRQELVTVALASVTLLFHLARRRAARGAGLSLSRGPRPTRFEALVLLPLAAFVLWGAASLAWASNEFPALHYALTWGVYLLFFLLTRRAAEDARLLRRALGLLAAVVLVISAANVVGYYGTPDSLLRQHGLCEPIAVSIPLFAALALRLRRARAALVCGATAALAWLTILQIAERASFVAVVAGLLLLAAAALASPRHRPRRPSRAVLLALAFAVCFALQAVPSPFSETFHQPILTRLKETSAGESNTRARLLYWSAAVEMWRTRPLTGVGARGFEAAMPAARAALAARRPDSPLVEVNEKFLNTGAHNEYLQILAELGAVGFALFVAFAGALVCAAWRALRRSGSPLAAGAVASLAVFALSSGASDVSFRWMGSGLVFFFAAALVLRLALAPARGVDESAAERPSLLYKPALQLGPAFARRASAAALVFCVLALCVLCAQAGSVLMLARAQAGASPAEQHSRFETALALNPYDPALRYNYGMWLLYQRREAESVAHLRYAVARGFTTSTCYAYLASAEEAAGDPASAEQTLARGVRVYPRSIFLRVRHAAALGRAGRAAESQREMARALELNSHMARGWQQLIEHDIDAAVLAARADSSIALPGELYPEDAVFAVLRENERRFPAAVHTGWRARMRRGFTE